MHHNASVMEPSCGFYEGQSYLINVCTEACAGNCTNIFLVLTPHSYPSRHTLCAFGNAL